ncbi:MAG: RICIN domain-containing protein [Fibrobacter sp.]|nr:RICIN domain-containing protein [Fibrobacter sp.]
MGLKCVIFSAVLEASVASVFALEAYPEQQFRFGIGNTDRNISISGKNAGDYLSSSTIQGTAYEKWTLNFISSGVFEIVNVATGMVVTHENGLATIGKDVDGANQRWKIIAVEKDFEGYPLYYKVVSQADTTQAFTFDVNSNSIAVSAYAKGEYQKFKLNLDGLEGYAANAMTPNGEKAGTIGGLLGEVVYVSTDADLIKELDSEEPKTIVVTADIDMQTHAHTRIRDFKTLVGSYAKHTLYDTYFRTNNEYGNDEPSDNIVIRNFKLIAKNQPNRILINVWSSRQIWIDHIYFESQLSYDRTGNGLDEVGKFIWINTPYESYMDAKDRLRSPDYVTISYCHLENRYWTVAYGTQNDELTRDRTTLLYNWWDKNVRRCPQLGNGSAHVYNNYYSAYGNASNGSGTSGIIGGDGSEMLSMNNRFNGYTLAQALMMGGGSDPSRDDNSYLSEALDATPNKISFSPVSKSSWKPEQTNYGYSLLDSYNSKGTDTKDFCSKYAGDQSAASDMKYITDSEFDSWVSVRYPSPFLKSIDVGSEPVGGYKEGAEIDATKKFLVKNVNSDFYLSLAVGILENGLDVVQGSVQTPWFVTAADSGYYYVKLAQNAAYFLDLANGNVGNGTNIAIWEDTKNPAQLFKFVANEDGSFSITTKNTKDKSCLGIGAASKEENASVIQWTCDGTTNQSWILEEYVEEPSLALERGNPFVQVQLLGKNLQVFNGSGQNLQVSLYDLAGTRLMQKDLRGSGVHSLELGDGVSKGVFIVKVKGISMNRTLRLYAF